jgi:hypothetical protein
MGTFSGMRELSKSIMIPNEAICIRVKFQLGVQLTKRSGLIKKTLTT